MTTWKQLALVFLLAAQGALAQLKKGAQTTEEYLKKEQKE
jgi:hypothetical protein